MKILSITAQKPSSTGSGVYLTEVVKALKEQGHVQAVMAGVTREDKVELPEGVTLYPVYFESEELPYPVVGMSDEMPYKSTRYMDMTEEMTKQFKTAFLKVLDQAVEKEDPDLILCHHLYYLTALVRERYPEKKVYGFCHNTDLRQMENTAFQREFIRSQIPALDRIFALQKMQKDVIQKTYQMSDEHIQIIGTGYNSHIFYREGEKASRCDQIKRMIFAGKITQKKGVNSFLRALNLLDYDKDHLKITLAGGAGNEKEYREIVELAEQCRYKVEFAGCVSQIRLAQLYNESDIFVLPSMFEGLPLTVIESLACADRVVMTELPGVKEWLDETVPGADIRYVKLPRMRGADEPVEEDLPAFEERLAKALCEALEEKIQSISDVNNISWERIAEEVIR